MRSTELPPRRQLRDHQEPGPEPGSAARDLRAWPPVVADGTPRKPSELFDNLRLRLSELAANHPSHPGHAGQPDRAADADDPGGAEAEDIAGAGRGERAREPGEPGAAAGGLPGQLADALGAATLAAARLSDAAGAAALGAMNPAGSTRHADPYRPWFMSGEPANPWWAAGGDLWG